jgi:hypothetical protein
MKQVKIVRFNSRLAVPIAIGKTAEAATFCGKEKQLPSRGVLAATMSKLRKFSPAILGSKIKVVIFAIAVGEDARPRQRYF